MNQHSINISNNKAISLQMVEIPQGQIIMRDDRIKHTWTANIQPFLMAKYLVTQDLYFEFTKDSPSTFKGNKKPVETVSWIQAVVFCNLLSENSGFTPCYSWNNDSEEIFFDNKANGYRLPTEAEWEYTCKAGTTSIRYSEIDRIAWYKENSEKTTHDVGTKEPNSFGLYDMLGNVWEWCSDIYNETVYGSYRIFRGGGWYDNERGCMATNRRRSHPTSFKIDDLGFRLARNL
ncbi:formylglycine-generating enzyme family protein [Flavobacterium sp. LS1R49]|uniref:Formylglycine-generating enzyme family protein n=1 Tax=Flavobacterium shii TaxID=2987687 RepID=A0A9X2Z9S6_9FLAO|nr:formylglycine-generating enzyme family protein [Flavobacterium shii]MCV9926105.1 formylglycine-generating enzyme family protein [Flavobacterium shii]